MRYQVVIDDGMSLEPYGQRFDLYLYAEQCLKEAKEYVQSTYRTPEVVEVYIMDIIPLKRNTEPYKVRWSK